MTIPASPMWTLPVGKIIATKLHVTSPMCGRELLDRLEVRAAYLEGGRREAQGA